MKIETLLLQSPYIPYMKGNEEKIAEVCHKKKLQVGIYCGELDEICHDMAAGLYHKLADAGVSVHLVWQPELRHRFPDKIDEGDYGI